MFNGKSAINYGKFEAGLMTFVNICFAAGHRLQQDIT